MLRSSDSTDRFRRAMIDCMFFSSRARNRDLAQLCRRLAISLESGLEVRKIFAREAAGRSPLGMRRRMQMISARVSAGGALADAFDEADPYFPTLMCRLIRVGEQTGKLDESFRHLAEHYEFQVRMRREFMSSISWPLMQLGLALTVVGLVIWISGFIRGKDLQGREIDILGFGLRGTSGLIEYLAIVGCIAAAFFFVMQAVRRGVFWARPIQRAMLLVPAAGTALQTLAISRFAWTLHLTGESGMSILKALPLCLQATQNDRYISQSDSIVTSVRRGDSLTDALTATQAFPTRFLDTLDVGERSGRMPEAMKLLTGQYQDEARAAVKILMQVASWVVTILVMGLICYFIFRIANMYVGTIKAAGQLK
jgi:type IV pilus assembly protein PilC